LKPVSKPIEGYGDSPTDNDFLWETADLLKSAGEGGMIAYDDSSTLSDIGEAQEPVLCMRGFGEVGIGRGGRIHQKIYPDPYGIEVWQDAPVAAVAVYVVNAQSFEEITGEKIPVPVGHETYEGLWYGLKDQQEADVTGTSKFTGLKSAFLGDLSNISPETTKAKQATANKPGKKTKAK